MALICVKYALTPLILVAEAVLVLSEVSVPVTALESEKMVEEPLVPAITNLSVFEAVPETTRVAELSKDTLTEELKLVTGLVVPAAELVNSNSPEEG